MIKKFSTLLVILVLVFCLTMTVNAQTDCGFLQTIAIPSYFYPGGHDGNGNPNNDGQAFWDQMGDAYPNVGLVVINPGIYSLTPEQRPGYIPDPNYVTQVVDSKNAGLIVLGYVPTGDDNESGGRDYGERDINSVYSDIDIFYNHYDVDGIFLDEVPANCSYVSYYEDIFNYIKAKGGIAKVVLNPGNQTDECFMSVCDIVVTFEGFYEPVPGAANPGQWYKDNYLAPSWVGQYSPDRFWHLVHSLESIEDMQHAIQLSKDRNVGWIYVTPDSLTWDNENEIYEGNPWNSLPIDQYWSEELLAVQPVVDPTICTWTEMPTDILHWWPGNGNTDDIIGGENGSIHSYYQYSVGKIQEAFTLGFGGYHDYVSLGSGPSITGFGDFTIDVWVATYDSIGVIIQQRDRSDYGYDGQYVLSIDGIDKSAGFPDAPGRICFSTYENGQFGLNFSSSLRVDDGLFHHIVAVRELDGTGKIYIDGILDGEQSAIISELKPLEVFIGGDRRNYSNAEAYLNGLIDEVSIYGRALSNTEIEDIYNSGHAGKKPPTRIEGIIAQSTTWNLEDSPYLVTSKLIVPPDVELEIKPGVLVYFNFYSNSIEVYGTLTANDATFTTLVEPVSDPPQWSEHWAGIIFWPGSSGELTNCAIQNGACPTRHHVKIVEQVGGNWEITDLYDENDPTTWVVAAAEVVILSDDVLIDDGSITGNYGHGIWCKGSKPFIQNVEIEKYDNNLHNVWGIFCTEPEAHPTISNCNL